MNNNEPFILLAEDDENDVFFMRRALRKAGVELPLHVVKNGQEALDFLSGTGDFANRSQCPPPSLVLLDLKMPFVNGFEVLAWIGSQASLKHIPIVVLTSSAEDRDRQKVMELGAKAYFVKPPTVETVKAILRFLNQREEHAAVAA
jgi:CheY-like chemotaxis protein